MSLSGLFGQITSAPSASVLSTTSTWVSGGLLEEAELYLLKIFQIKANQSKARPETSSQPKTQHLQGLHALKCRRSSCWLGRFFGRTVDEKTLPRDISEGGWGRVGLARATAPRWFLLPWLIFQLSKVVLGQAMLCGAGGLRLPVWGRPQEESGALQHDVSP